MTVQQLEWIVKPTVIVCDENDLTRAAFKGMLEGQGFDVVDEVSSGIEVVAAYKTHMPLLVTIGLAGSGGAEVDAVRNIMAIDPDAGILICSELGQESEAYQALSAGARAWMVKPITAEKILAVVPKALSTDPAAA